MARSRTGAEREGRETRYRDHLSGEAPEWPWGGATREGRVPEYGLLVRFAAYTGLRAGELGALRAGRLDLLRRRVEVTESVGEVRGRLVLDRPRLIRTVRYQSPVFSARRLLLRSPARAPVNLSFQPPRADLSATGTFMLATSSRPCATGDYPKQ